MNRTIEASYKSITVNPVCTITQISVSNDGTSNIQTERNLINQSRLENRVRVHSFTWQSVAATCYRKLSENQKMSIHTT